MQLEIKQLRIDGGTQPREKIDDCVVADYMDHLREGVAFPPVVVFFDSSAYWLADGFHRYYANRRLARTHIEAEVHEGTLRDAILYSVGANCEHGLRRSNADKHRAVETMLTNKKVAMDDEGNPWSDREIARRCRVSHHTVAKHRQQLEARLTGHLPSEKESMPEKSDSIDSSSGLTGESTCDDATADTAKRTYITKHGTRSTMNTGNIGKSKSKPKKEWGKLSPRAGKPIRGHSVHVPKKALDLPFDPCWAARALYSAFEEDFIRNLIVELNQCLKGVSYDPREENVS